MRNSGRLLVATMLGFGVVTACSSFSGSDESSAPDDEGGVDAPATPPDHDTGMMADARAGDAAPVNLISNGDFNLGCGAWGASPNAALTPLDGGNSNRGSCQVCVDGGGSFNFGQTVMGTLPEGKRLQMSSSVEKPAMAPPVASVGPVLRTFVADGGILAASGSSPISIGDNWTPVDALLDVGKGVVSFSLNFGAAAPDGGGCFVVDDVVVTLTDP